jgi:hypothetical protein
METQQPAKNKGGRPVGAISKLSREAREKAAASGILPHEFLLQIVRGEPIFRTEVHPMSGEKILIQETYDFDARRDAAKAAAPYYAPKISTVEVINGVSEYELDQIIERAAAEAGVSIGNGGEGPESPSEDGSGESALRRRRRVKLLE